MLILAPDISSEMWHKFLILDDYHPDTLYLHKLVCEDSYLFFKYKGTREEESLGNIAISNLSVLSVKFQPTFRDSGSRP